MTTSTVVQIRNMTTTTMAEPTTKEHAAGRLVLVAAVMALLVLVGIGGFALGHFSNQPTPIPATTTPALTTSESDLPDSTQPSDPTSAQLSDLPPVRVADLPPEASETLQLISNGGPYPFDQDNGIFQNREGLLPDRPRGYYREYTVVTPGSDNRGARRIVSGDGGELFYTSDHYDSFSEIVS